MPFIQDLSAFPWWVRAMVWLIPLAIAWFAIISLRDCWGLKDVPISFKVVYTIIIVVLPFFGSVLYYYHRDQMIPPL